MRGSRWRRSRGVATSIHSRPFGPIARTQAGLSNAVPAVVLHVGREPECSPGVRAVELDTIDSAHPGFRERELKRVEI